MQVSKRLFNLETESAFDILAKAKKLELEGKDIINLGEIAYWIDGKSIAIGYGKTPISQNNEIRLAAKTNIWGDAVLDVKELGKIRDGDEIIIS